MSLSEYQEAILNGYEFLDNYGDLLHSLKLSRTNADYYTYTKETQNVGNEPLQPSEGISQPSDGEPA